MCFSIYYGGIYSDLAMDLGARISTATSVDYPGVILKSKESMLSVSW